MIGPSNLRVLAITLIVVGFLVALLARDRIDPNAVSVEMPYIPTGEKVTLVTTSFEGVWKGMLSHVDATYDSLNHFTDYALFELSEINRHSCMQKGQAVDFDRLGLDSSRNAVMALYGPLSAVPDEWSMLAVVPLRDTKAFEDVARRLQVMSDPLQSLLTALDPSRKAERIRVDKITVSAGGFICWADGSPIEPGQIVPAEEWSGGLWGAKLNLKWDDDLDLAFHIECTAFDATDQAIECGCRDATDGNFGEISSKEGCSWTSAGRPEGERRAQFVEVAGKKYPVLRPLDFWVSVVDTGHALISTDPVLLENALTAPSRQVDLAYPANARPSEMAPGEPRGDLVGELLIPGPVLVSKVPIALQVSPDAVHLQADLKLIAGNTHVLQALLENETLKPVPAVQGTIVSADLTGEQGSKLLRFANRWVPESQEMVDTALGDLSVAMQHLAESDSLDVVRIHLLGMRDGIPDLVVMARLPEQDARALIEDVQWEMKVKRDTGLIDVAAAKSGSDQISIADLISQGLLKPEEGTNWLDYSIVDVRATPPERPPNGVAPSDRGMIEGQPVDFLMPPFTENDYALRLEDTDDAAKVDKEGLFAGRYRLAAMYVAKDGLLWIGNDASTLKLLLDNIQPPGSVADDMNPVGRADTRKITFMALPDLLLGLWQAHPDPDLASAAQDLSQFRRYHLLTVSVSSHSDRQELGIDVAVTR